MVDLQVKAESLLAEMEWFQEVSDMEQLGKAELIEQIQYWTAELKHITKEG